MRNRPCLDDYYMTEALWIKARSPDENTQHGCIITTKSGKPLAQGYNGFPRGCVDSKMPQSRPEKYSVILHSEENAILSCDVSMEGATAYITGPPCVKCWAHLIQKGIKKVIYGPIRSKSPNSNHQADEQLISLMLENHDIEIIEWAPKNCDIIINELINIIDIIIKLKGRLK